MPKAIKVGVNQWATLDRSVDDAELMTADLAGCVAIAVRTQDKIGLTHVFNGAIKDGKLDEAHRENVVRFMEKFGGPENIQELHLVRNHPAGIAEPPQSLAPQLKTLLVSGGLVDPQSIHMHSDSGCAIARNAFYLRQKDDHAIYDIGPTNTRLEELDSDTQSRLNGHFETGNYQDVGYYTEFEVLKKPSNIAHERAAMAGPGVEKAPTNASSRKSKLFDDDSDDDAHSFAPEKTRVGDSSMPTSSKFRGSNSNRRRDIEDDDFFIVPDSKHGGSNARRGRRVEDEASSSLVSPKPTRHGTASLDEEFVSPHAHRKEKKRGRDEAPHNTREQRSEPNRSTSRAGQPPSSSDDHADTQEPIRKKTKRSDQSQPERPERPQTLYAQAHHLLEQTELGQRHPDHLVEAARQLASQARRDGLTAISAVQMGVGEDGRATLTARQDNAGGLKQSSPMAVAQMFPNAQVAQPQQDREPEQHRGPRLS